MKNTFILLFFSRLEYFLYESRNKRKMITLIFAMLYITSSMLVLGSCTNSAENNSLADSTSQNTGEWPTEAEINAKAEEFITSLKNGKELNTFITDKWTLIYHEDNRVDGSTDGQTENLRNTQIDSIIRLQIRNDGESWDSPKKEPRNFELNFKLQKRLNEWDRIEIRNSEFSKKGTITLVGNGESDYIILHFNADRMIKKLEYHSEDPG